MKYPGHQLKHTLADGTEVLWNRIQGYSVEDVASMCLRPLTEKEQAEVDQMDDAELDAQDRHDDDGKEMSRERETSALADDANREMFGDETAELMDLGILSPDIGNK